MSVRWPAAEEPAEEKVRAAEKEDRRLRGVEGEAERGQAGRDADGSIRPGNSRPTCFPGLPGHRTQLLWTIRRKHEQTNSYGRFLKFHSFSGPRRWHIEIRHRVKNTHH